jgi:hypothetical protein
MRLRDDDRGQSVQIGAVLLFAVLIVAFSSYQAFVVPDQNREVEFNHNQQVHGEMQELRNQIVSVAGGGAGGATSVTLGTTYPSRLVALNPGPASGTLRTAGTTDNRINVSIDNAKAPGETGDVWDGTNRSYNTGAVVYSPGYNLYTGAPDTTYEQSVLYNEFRSGTIVLANQTVVDGDRISLVALNGSFDRGSAATTSLDVRSVSSSERTVPVTDDGDNITISFASRLPADRWEQLLSDEDNVVDVRSAAGSAPDGFGLVTVELARDVDYRLQLTKVGVGTGVTSEDASYVTNISPNETTVTNGATAEVVVEARDRYNNPVTDVRVNASTDQGSLESTSIETDDEGRATFEFNTSQLDPGTYYVDTSLGEIDGSYTAAGPRNATIAVQVVSLGGGSYSLTWDRDQIASQRGIACSDRNCTFNVNATSSADLTAETDPALDGVSVDYSTTSGAPASIDPGSGETANGRDTTILTEAGAADGDSVSVYANAGGGSDTLDVLFETGPFFEVTIDDYDRVVSPGDTLTVDVTIENTGSESDTQDIEFYFDGTLQDTRTETLASGGSTSFTFTYDTTGTDEGDYPIEVLSNDSRDSATRTVTVDDVPYFQVTEFSAPTEAYEGETITVDATVENTGTGTDTQTIEYRFNGVTRDSETVTLDPGESTTVQSEYTIRENDGTYTHGYDSENDSDTASIEVQDVPVRSRVVYVDSGTGDLSTVTLVGTTKTYGVVDSGATGPIEADLVGGSGADIPYKDSSGDGYLEAVEDDGSTSLVDDTDITQAPMGVGDWDEDGTTEVVYVRNGVLYDVEPGSSPNEIQYSVSSGRYDCNNGQSPCNVDAVAVAGIGDITGDGSNEIVYVDADNSDLAYFDGTDEIPITTGLPSSTGVSTPADFNGDGTVRVAAQDGNGGITFYEADGTEFTPGSTPSGTVAQSPMAAADWNDDGTRDVIYLDQNNGELRYWDPATGETGLVTDQDGNVITAATGPGAR